MIAFMDQEASEKAEEIDSKVNCRHRLNRDIMESQKIYRSAFLHSLGYM